MELPPDQPTLTLHAERITISGDRYLIYYTFTTSGDEPESDAGQKEE